MIITTRKQLLAAVPVHDLDGRPCYIRISEIPEPWRAQVMAEIIACAAPVVDGEGELRYAWDWYDWVWGLWWGKPGPTGLR